MLNIKDKDLRNKLWFAGLIAGNNDDLTTNAHNMVSKVNDASQKLDAIAKHLGLVFVKNQEEASRWKLVKKDSPEANVEKAACFPWSVSEDKIRIIEEESGLLRVRKKRGN